MRILLIEPDKMFADNYRYVLEQAGHTVSWQPTAQSAIHQADHYKPDLIVLELQLPAHNGVEFLYELRSYPEWQQIPVIVLSLVPREAVAGSSNLLEQLGVKGFLYKPQTKLRQLIAAVDKISEPLAV